VILPPQVAIGAFGKIRKVPYLEDEGDDEYEPTVGTRNMMNIFWAADHRVNITFLYLHILLPSLTIHHIFKVIDGATLARFSNRFKQFLESPPLFFSELR
jgi:2-oxoisovalerate dehydrogenase E2 component (dihydrolipoyl transacylase)